MKGMTIMIYVTVKQTEAKMKKPGQVTLADLLRDINFVPQDNDPRIKIYPRTYTFPIERTDDRYKNLLSNYPIKYMSVRIIALANKYRNLLLEDMSEHYNTFFIPKHSHGFRRIDAPNPDLMNALSEVKDLFQKDLLVLPHNAAHAYTSKRSIVTAMQLHQSAESKWFLKLDLQDFFPNHNYAYIMGTLEMLFPFSAMMTDPETKEALSTLVKLGLLNDSLPQGTPLSPILTNILMVPIDHAIAKLLYDYPHQTFVYTRYADDICISSKYHFRHDHIEHDIRAILQMFNAPFKIKNEKTRYGSSAGRNWNLGIMLNKDNQLTIGHKQNQRFRAAVDSFFKDLTNGNPWNKMDVQVLLGQISYYESIEPEYVKSVLTRYSNKFGRDFKQTTKAIITTI
jgi:hypothetical protein